MDVTGFEQLFIVAWNMLLYNVVVYMLLFTCCTMIHFKEALHRKVGPGEFASPGIGISQHKSEQSVTSRVHVEMSLIHSGPIHGSNYRTRERTDARTVNPLPE